MIIQEHAARWLQSPRAALWVSTALVLVISSCSAPPIPPQLMDGLVRLRTLKPDAENLCSNIKAKKPTPADSALFEETKNAYRYAALKNNAFIVRFTTLAKANAAVPAWSEVSSDADSALLAAAEFMTVGRYYLEGKPKPSGTQGVDSVKAEVSDKFELWSKGVKAVLDWWVKNKAGLLKDQADRLASLVEELRWKDYEKVKTAASPK